MMYGDSTNAQPEPKAPPTRFKSLDDLATDPDEEPNEQRSSGMSIWGYFRHKGSILRSNSLTDLFATAMGYEATQLRTDW